MKIGFTERGDAGRDLSWVAKCAARQVDGAVVITKTLFDPCAQEILNLHRSGFPLILHATCTGWGGSVVEPHVWEYRKQLDAVQRLVGAGFPTKNIVLRIDPIFPTGSGIDRVLELISAAKAMGLIGGSSPVRLRVSVLDEYKHVKQRFTDIGFGPIYGDAFYAPDRMMADVARALRSTGLRFETCAETKLAAMAPDVFVPRGCLSRTDLDIMGLDYDKAFVNPQGRSGCLCLGCKTELLARREQCPNRCAYCYWKG